MKTVATDLPGVVQILPDVHRDHRGHLVVASAPDLLAAAHIPCRFVQDNISHSLPGVCRGLHYQLPPLSPEELSDEAMGQAKLIWVVRGRILDVSVDIRRGSPTFGRHAMVELGDDGPGAVFLPQGFAHGFYALEETDLLYKCSDVYRPDRERGIRFDDPDLAIPWPNSRPMLSERDRTLPHLARLADHDLPLFVS